MNITIIFKVCILSFLFLSKIRIQIPKNSQQECQNYPFKPYTEDVYTFVTNGNNGIYAIFSKIKKLRIHRNIILWISLYLHVRKKHKAMHYKNILTFLTFFILSAFTHDVCGYNLRQISNIDGLSNSAVLSLYQDHLTFS